MGTLFVRRFVKRLSARLFAHSVVKKIIVPLGAARLNHLMATLELGHRLETLANNAGNPKGLKGAALKKAGKAAVSKTVKRLAPAFGPIVNMAISANVANVLHLEDNMAYALGDRKVGASAAR